ncbi:DNA polymerase III subunit epsilon [Bacillus cereus]|uniref:DNA polymerase III subunit epsilon n=1 Tax=Bacillus cereus TaxID=1396 RepID=A0A9X0SQ77_BACCE|nr:3'-5' exonuclease [Bacillus cereus]KXY51306.1 DNA polymerase III subunit epsilon [Bacillus cereus]PES55246.1 3'-5' exonuclease [Bacillus cereus]PEZ74860.1 3'-5' exonuclease [Bacillus anthracis]PGW11019.1 3'-5' exonuclease [Bacillus cereus]
MATKKETQKMLNLLGRNNFVVLDIETTELSPTKGGRIAEIGAVKYVDGKIVDTYSQLLNPEMKISNKITKLTGITNDMVQGKPVYGQVLPKFYQFINGFLVIAHNAKFDWNRFLLFYFEKVGIHPENEVLDSIAVFKHFCPGRRKYNLDEFCTTFGYLNKNRHRAFEDAEATGECLLELKRRFANEIPVVKEEPVPVQPVQKVSQPEIFVKRVKYWEKKVSSTKLMKRQYVNINDKKNYGTVYFDIPTQTWYNNNYPGEVDFSIVNEKVLQFLNLNSTIELCSFKN